MIVKQESSWSGGEPYFAEARYACPVCKKSAVLIMAASCQLIVAQDASAVVNGEIEYADDAPAKCHAGCGWRGYVHEAEMRDGVTDLYPNQSESGQVGG